MINKKTVIIVLIIGAIAIGGGLFIMSRSDKQATTSTSAQNNIETAQPESLADNQTLSEQNAPVTSAYTTLDSLNANPEKYAQTDKVYFFHANWCPICKGIDAEISANLEKLPSGISIVKTDYDTATDLRKQFGVTTQYTFVQVDKNNQQVAKWTATSFDKMLAGITASQ